LYLAHSSTFKTPGLRIDIFSLAYYNQSLNSSGQPKPSKVDSLGTKRLSLLKHGIAIPNNLHLTVQVFLRLSHGSNSEGKDEDCFSQHDVVLATVAA